MILQKKICAAKVNGPLEDLLMGITPEKHDVILIDAGNQHDCVIVDPAKPRKLFSICHKIGNRLFILVHGVISVFWVKNSSTNA